MKRSSSKADLPQVPPQLQIRAIQVYTGQLPPPPSPAPSPPAMVTVPRPSFLAWPQPVPAFFTLSANQAYPLGSFGLSATPQTVLLGTRVAAFPTNSNVPAAPLPGSSERYTQSKLAGKTEVEVKLATPADLAELANTLRSSHNTVTKITLISRAQSELFDAFDVICKSLSILDLEVYHKGPMPAPEVLNRLFSGLKERQAPLKSFRWLSTQHNGKPLKIDQGIFESLFALQLLERVQFSGPPDHPPLYVIVNNADQLAASVEKHRSLKSLSLDRIDSPVFINAILQGVSKNPIFEEMHLEYINLDNCGVSLQHAVNRNTKLRSLSIKGCKLKFHDMTTLLKLIQQRPALESLDFSQAKIPAEELQIIGESIGELLLSNPTIKTLRIRQTLSAANIAAITIGLNANTSLTFLEMDAIEDAHTLQPDPPETDAHPNLEDLFRSNKGLREIVIRMPGSNSGSDDRILDSIAQNSSIESLTIENFANVNELINLLARNPRIKHLKVKMQEIRDANRLGFPQSVRDLADNLSNNQSLLSFSLVFHPRDDGLRNIYLRPVIEDVRKNILKIVASTTRNRLRSMASQVAAAMSMVQAWESTNPEVLPTLPKEVNQLLFEAVLDVLSPQDAKKVYDAIMPFEPI